MSDSVRVDTVSTPMAYENLPTFTGPKPWITDSGSMLNICAELDYFVDYTPYGPNEVYYYKGATNHRGKGSPASPNSLQG